LRHGCTYQSASEMVSSVFIQVPFTFSSDLSLLSSSEKSSAASVNIFRSGARVSPIMFAFKLLRELENPNLHDIRNMSFRVELWDQHALHIRWVIAAAGSVFLARAAFEEAVKQWPDQKLTLR
jgi:hypothetical protein